MGVSFLRNCGHPAYHGHVPRGLHLVLDIAGAVARGQRGVGLDPGGGSVVGRGIGAHLGLQQFVLQRLDLSRVVG
jgi:hypothetical protein